jgi:hypothetical protein
LHEVCQVAVLTKQATPRSASLIRFFVKIDKNFQKNNFFDKIDKNFYYIITYKIGALLCEKMNLLKLGKGT